MVYKDEGYIYKEAEFENVDVVIDDHFTGDRLAVFKVIEEEEC